MVNSIKRQQEATQRQQRIDIQSIPADLIKASSTSLTEEQRSLIAEH
uniref:Uncharacterized protein n=1 Tax=Acrobeloides nanus TaxID=290746 RepID=A0A914D751_9BILA